eukprot:gene13978-biopygen23086
MPAPRPRQCPVPSGGAVPAAVPAGREPAAEWEAGARAGFAVSRPCTVCLRACRDAACGVMVCNHHHHHGLSRFPGDRLWKQALESVPPASVSLNSIVRPASGPRPLSFLPALAKTPRAQFVPCHEGAARIHTEQHRCRTGSHRAVWCRVTRCEATGSDTKKQRGAAWSRAEQHRSNTEQHSAQTEQHGCRAEQPGATRSRAEQCKQRGATQIRAEQHRAERSNTEQPGAAWSRAEQHGATWS